MNPDLTELKKAQGSDEVALLIIDTWEKQKSFSDHAISFEKGMRILRRTSERVFLIGFLISGLLGTGGTYFFLRSYPNSSLEILRKEGIDVRITDANDEVKLWIQGGSFKTLRPIPSQQDVQGMQIVYKKRSKQ